MTMHSVRAKARGGRKRSVSLALMAMACVWVVGCGDDSDAPSMAVTATPRATHSPTPSPTVQPAPHEHMEIGSHHAGGGELMVHYDFANSMAPLSLSACVGGAEPDCQGGTRVYAGSSPAFATVDADAAGDHLEPLPDGTEVIFELIAIDDGLQIQLEGSTLSQAGQEILLGAAPFHVHAEWQLLAPSGIDVMGRTFAISFRLRSSNPAFEPSATYTLLLQVDEHADSGGHAH